MADSINTHYVKGGFVTSDDIELCVTATTRIIFRPAMHEGGVRGYIIRQKIGKDGKWHEISEVDFRKLDGDGGVKIELDTEATTKLYDKLVHLYEVQKKGAGYGDQSYVVAKKNEVLLLDDAAKGRAIQELLDQGHSTEFWEELSKKDPDLATRLAAAKIQVDRQDVIRQFQEALTTHPEDESFWQGFFEEHPWILQTAFSAPVFMLGGETYVGGKLPTGRQGEGGVATDFLFADESTKSFAVVEIKTPATELVGAIYRGETGTGFDNETYGMHQKLSGSVVQTRNQISTACEQFEAVLGRGYRDKINRVHPKGVLVIGTIGTLDQRKLDSFNQFRHGLYSLTVITFDELLRRLQILYDIAPDDNGEALDDSIIVESVIVEDIGDEPIDLDSIPF